MDTIRWRIREEIDNINMSTVQEFLDKPFCFFQKQDRCGRPILVIQLQYMPQLPSSDIVDYLTPFVIFMLETARKYTAELTNLRLKAEDPGVVTDMLVLADFKSTRGLPMDRGLLQAFIQILKRYPGMTGSVCLLNFGWMYQGVWQMCKLLLTEEAKNRVSFPRIKELESIIDDDDLLADLNGSKAVTWDVEQDSVYAKYQPRFSSILPSPPSSPRLLSRRNSSASMHSVYYETSETLGPSASSFLTPLTPVASHLHLSFTSASSVYATPIGTLSPVPSYSNLSNVAKTYALQPPKLRSSIKAFLAPDGGSSGGSRGVSSRVLKQKLREVQRERLSLSSGSGSLPDRWRRLLFRLWLAMEERAGRMLQKTVEYRNTFYWIAACVILRNRLREVLQSMFILLIELLVDRSTEGNAVGWRSLLRLTTGQMTL
ncbi:hypothetical protein DFQ28_004464 [Apophysomyces sp. BC1034]|nr:hypothetical protein DFQ30_002721 [Apophysomyces sp. BC1015]KAG0182883.1 hypothetical protein DFQ29_001582 [Apophysomyces sp. BC1021]KAG0193572.1 hypothetical protein DFQ28_004464 [Apophysomyces sp. BC1034]